MVYEGTLVGQIILLSFTSAANPTLIAVVTVMLLLPNPKRLMVGYLCGALLMSITLGLVIVFDFPHSATVTTTQHTLSPAADVALGAVALTIAFVLGTQRDERFEAARRRRRATKPQTTPRWEKALDKGSAASTFVLGAALTLPGASYLLALHELKRLDYGTVVTVVIIVAFNIVMLALLELPLAGYLFAPEWTPRAVDRAKAWVSDHWRRFAVIGLGAVGAALVIKGTIGLLLG
jgi:Sap, sulfolipid-1-addressing protein